MTADELKKDVLDWIEENPNALLYMREIAKRLATSHDMTSAWNELAKPEYGIQKGRHIMSMAQHAADAANHECSITLIKTEGAKRLSAMEKAARKLIVAIERAPLPDSVDFIDVDGKPTIFALRGKFTEGNKSPLQRIELTTLLEYAAERAAELRQATPARMIERQSHNPEIAVFVRHIAMAIKDKTGKKMMGTVARIATAALDHSNTISKQQVESILNSIPK